ncbi:MULTISPECIES: TetR/AcrR family transcriptional regulator [unclassified Amycolatopsis]|uniref:TetR/AcrR family transcriptional regulator n=1 Tax=unclassified Amycolatopsis TaxID=2618356 RepID=UPI00142FA352|nr:MULTISPECIES: TetR/AcrR family transcriptional regulator C-terminal domain-containing protein [unclassified Amycolatopsis]
MSDHGKRQLTGSQIITAAIELIDAEGLAKFSMRRLGAHLGVEGMAIYHHFSGKEALLDEVTGSISVQDTTIPPDHLSWRDQLRITYSQFRTNVLSHPNLAERLLTRPAQNIESARIAEAQYRALAQAGLTDSALVAAHRTIGSYVVGFIAIEVNAMTGAVAEPRWNLDQLSDQFPLLTKIGTYTEELSWDAQFETGLDVVFDAASRLSS